ncbi:MAG: hypothetical protein ACK47B_18495 [Armatimonadota bacterium]
MNRIATYLTGLAALTLAASPALSAREARPLTLRDASPAEAARELGRALGTAVEIRGGARRTLSLELPGGAPSRTLAAFTARLGGTWKPKLVVRAGRMEQPEESPELEKTLAIGFQDVSAARAFATVARELKAELELRDELEVPVSLVAVNVPAHVVLDRLCAAVEASWSLVYVIELPDAPVPPVVPRVEPEPAPVETPRAEPEKPAPPPGTAPETPKPREPEPPAVTPLVLRNALREALKRVVIAAPDARPEAVREFGRFGEELVKHLDAMPAAQRRDCVRFLLPAVTPWRRLYAGLAPTVKEQLSPVTELLDRHIPLR